MNSDHRAKWDGRYSARPLVWSAGPNATVVEHLTGVPPGRALDLGCGGGRNALWLAEKDWRVTGVDFSSVAITKARQIADRRGLEVDWINEDLDDFRPVLDHFELVLACFVHTSSAQRKVWLARATNAVCAGGTLLYLGHDPRNPAKGFGGPKDLDVLPSASDLAALLVEFEVEVATTIRRPIGKETGHGKPDANGTALDTLVKAVKRCAI